MTDEASSPNTPQPLDAFHYWMTDNFRAFLNRHRSGLGDWLSGYGIVWCLRVPGSQRTLLSLELAKGLEPHKSLDRIADLSLRFESNDETVTQPAYTYGILIEGNRFDFANDREIPDAEHAATTDEVLLKSLVR